MTIGFCSQLHLGNGGLNKFTRIVDCKTLQNLKCAAGHCKSLQRKQNMCDFPILLGQGNPLLWKFSQKTVVPSIHFGIQSTAVLYDDGQII